MILINLIKKEVIHFFRNKSNVETMFIFPVVLIVIMGFSLNGLMNVDKNVFENTKVYFKVNNMNTDNKYLQVFQNFKDNCTENMKIEFEEIVDDNIGKASVNNYKALAFITINEDKYDFYRNDKKEDTAQKIFRSVFNQYLEKYAVINTVVNENPNVISENQNIVVSEEGITSKGITSFTYYTFAELVLIILYISLITSVSVYNEAFENTLARLKISKVSDFTIIAAKAFLGVIVGIFQVIIVYFVSTVFLKISWSKNLSEIILVLLALIIFSSILGVTIGYVFKDSKSSSSLINTLLIIFGFLGGSYVPISLVKSNVIADLLCRITPTYWANIALLSSSSNINTNYSIISIVLSLELSLILLSICIISSNLKGGDKVV